MTRLRTEWISYMLDGMDEYNRQLKEKTGMNLTELAAAAFSIDEDTMRNAESDCAAAVIPVTQGEGIITDFSQAVAAIIRSMGFKADVMAHTDVDGVYDAMRGGYQILFFADDVRYLAVHTGRNRFSDNNYATALGFVQVMLAMMRKKGVLPEQEKILQIGFGTVGREAAGILREKDIDFVLCDKDPEALAGFDGETVSSAGEIKKYKYILDFTNEGQWLHMKDLSDDVLYASPGVPCSLDEEAAGKLASHAVFDNLEIGTAMMLGQCLA